MSTSHCNYYAGMNPTNTNDISKLPIKLQPKNNACEYETSSSNKSSTNNNGKKIFISNKPAILSLNNIGNKKQYESCKFDTNIEPFESFVTSVDSEGRNLDIFILEEWKQSITDSISDKLDDEIKYICAKNEKLRYAILSDIELKWNCKAEKEHKLESLNAKHLLDHTAKERKKLEVLLYESHNYQKTVDDFKTLHNDLHRTKEIYTTKHTAIIDEIQALRNELGNKKAHLQRLKQQQDEQTLWMEKQFKENKATLTTIRKDIHK